MAKYRISVSFDGENFFWVVIEDMFSPVKVIWKPAEKELKNTVAKSYSKTNICETCIEEYENLGKELTGKSILYPKNVLRETDKNGKRTEKWVCSRHGLLSYQRYDPNSYHNTIKLMRDCRNNNLNPNSNAGIGYITAVLVKKFLGIEDCFEITDNFNYPGYDLLKHEKWGKIDVKGSSLVKLNDYPYHVFMIRNNKKADFFFCIGYDKDRKRVMVVYIIPNEDFISKMTTLSISYNGNSKWHKYKESEEIIKKWDDKFHTLKLDNCPVLKKGL